MHMASNDNPTQALPALSTKRRLRIRRRLPQHTIRNIYTKHYWRIVNPIRSIYWDHITNQRLMADRHVKCTLQEGRTIGEGNLYTDIWLSIDELINFLEIDDKPVPNCEHKILQFDVERNQSGKVSSYPKYNFNSWKLKAFTKISKMEIATRVFSYTSPAFLDVAFHFFESQTLSHVELTWSVRYRLTTKPSLKFRPPKVPRGKERAGWKLMARAAKVNQEVKTEFALTKRDLKRVQKALFGTDSGVVPNVLRQKFTNIITCELILVSIGIAIDTENEDDRNYQIGNHEFNLSDLHWLGVGIRKLQKSKPRLSDTDNARDTRAKMDVVDAFDRWDNPYGELDMRKMAEYFGTHGQLLMGDSDEEDYLEESDENYDWTILGYLL